MTWSGRWFWELTIAQDILERVNYHTEERRSVNDHIGTSLRVNDHLRCLLSLPVMRVTLEESKQKTGYRIRSSFLSLMPRRLFSVGWLIRGVILTDAGYVRASSRWCLAVFPLVRWLIRGVVLKYLPLLDRATGPLRRVCVMLLTAW